MSDRTPKQATVRAAWCRAHPFWATTDMEEREAEFDRMIAEIERRAAEKAWSEGAESAFYNPEIRGYVDYPDENPYRREGEE